MGDASPHASRGIRDYDDYLEVIDEIEKIEQIITPPKYRRCCYNVLEVLKAVIKHVKIKSKSCKWTTRMKKTVECH